MNKKLFLEWLRQQPADRKFSYSDIDGCLFASFLNETNTTPGRKFLVGGITYTVVDTTTRRAVTSFSPLPDWARDLAKRATTDSPIFSVQSVRALVINPTTPVSV